MELGRGEQHGSNREKLESGAGFYTVEPERAIHGVCASQKSAWIIEGGRPRPNESRIGHEAFGWLVIATTKSEVGPEKTIFSDFA